MADTVVVLAIEHKYGTNITAHKDRDSALQELERYVRQEWQHEFNSPLPDDAYELVSNYFDMMDEESYFIEEVVVLGYNPPEPKTFRVDATLAGSFYVNAADKDAAAAMVKAKRDFAIPSPWRMNNDFATVNEVTNVEEETPVRDMSHEIH